MLQRSFDYATRRAKRRRGGNGRAAPLRMTRWERAEEFASGAQEDSKEIHEGVPALSAARRFFLLRTTMAETAMPTK
jgi:hypothetical protein